MFQGQYHPTFWLCKQNLITDFRRYNYLCLGISDTIWFILITFLQIMQCCEVNGQVQVNRNSRLNFFEQWKMLLNNCNPKNCRYKSKQRILLTRVVLEKWILVQKIIFYFITWVLFGLLHIGLRERSGKKLLSTQVVI